MSAPVAHVGSSSSSEPSQITTTVEHVRPDVSDERIGSRKLKLSELGSLPSGAPLSADANLSSDDMRVECLLERLERERGANKSNDSVLSRIAGWVSDEKFLGSRRTSTAPRGLRFVEAGAESEQRSHCGDLQPTQDSGHAKSYGPDTWIAPWHVTQLLGPGCSGER